MDGKVPEQLDIEAPIVPGVGLGGLEIGTHVIALERLLNALPNRYRDMLWGRYVPLYEVRFNLGPVEIGVDIRTGNVFKLIAVAGYEGSLFGKVKLGMTIAQARIVVPELRFEDSSGVFGIGEHPGVALEVDDDDPDPDFAESMPITAISVYDTNLWRDYH